MNDYQLGADLRRQILGDRERGLACDGRRLQALVGDFCGERQSDLLPALKYLVMAPAFSSAIAQHPPLSTDGRLQLRLQQELDQVFAPAICRRMDAVLRGLLALPEAATPTPSAAPPTATAPPAAEPPAALPLPAAQRQPAARRAKPARSSRSVAASSVQPVASPTPGGRGLVAVLSFLAGMLVVAMASALAWLVLQSRPSTPLLPADPSTLKPAEPNSETPLAAEPATAPPPPNLDQASVEQAIGSVQQLYSHLSSGNVEAARQLFAGEAASQFDPSFFSQFQRVSVADLHETSRQGSTVTLQGVVLFEYPDGSSQIESRSFSVDTTSQPALITASSFDRVLQARQRNGAPPESGAGN